LDNKKSVCTVRKNFDVDASLGMSNIGSKVTDFSLSFVEKIGVFLCAVIELYSKLRGNTPRFRGIKVGFMENEYGIQIGSPITALGDVIYNSKENSLVLATPLYFLKDKKQLIEQLKKGITGKRVAMGIFGILALVSGYYLVKKLSNKDGKEDSKNKN